MTDKEIRELERARQGAGVGGDEVAPPCGRSEGAQAREMTTDDAALAEAMRVCQATLGFTAYRELQYRGRAYPVAGVGLSRLADLGGVAAGAAAVREALLAQGYELTERRLNILEWFGERTDDSAVPAGVTGGVYVPGIARGMRRAVEAHIAERLVAVAEVDHLPTDWVPRPKPPLGALRVLPTEVEGGAL